MVKVAIIGGGASGCFAAIQIQEFSKNSFDVSIFEKSKEPLSKLRISGGGRCNVTHDLKDPELLSLKYPRGQKELRWAFESFQPSDTIEWFRNKGVALKVESDGRMFPITDSSETIIECFIKEIENRKINLHLQKGIQSIFIEGIDESQKFKLVFEDNSEQYFDKVILASGSNRKSWKWMEALGHNIIDPVPSLFTLGIEDSSILSLSGLSMPNASIRISPKGKWQNAPLLITHWGFSGPAALRLSAWEARSLFDLNYKTEIEINWLGNINSQELEKIFLEYKEEYSSSKISNKKYPDFPSRLWEWFLTDCNIDKDKKWIDLSKNEIRSLANSICHSKFQMTSKGVFKEEFVTAGGISRKDINFKTMQSKKIPNLYFTGEVIDVDGITGGFNFQNAWTTATLAAKDICKTF
ncbi:MAG: NAD(P)/FAD-dependent oxidoreductase [Leptospira sp.]|jgi:predicted Rossmann fold flavoprotein|nr:NAD(P)/FAD-dependent oxidoreductase [Leptospira sp.]NCS92245.1 NAD(P)/FAD-dependent oxidoreductase [Leptospira sp.]